MFRKHGYEVIHLYNTLLLYQFFGDDACWYHVFHQRNKHNEFYRDFFQLDHPHSDSFFFLFEFLNIYKSGEIIQGINQLQSKFLIALLFIFRVCVYNSHIFQSHRIVCMPMNKDRRNYIFIKYLIFCFPSVVITNW